MGCYFTLFDGVPSEGDIERLKNNVPNQEAGRVSEKEITLSRANKKVRLWDYVVDCLSKGRQPDITKLKKLIYDEDNSRLWFWKVWGC